MADMLVMVSLDGLRGAALDDPAATIPTLRALAARGARVRRMRPVSPSVTWPCHTTLVTGVRPARHGVLGNNVFDRASGAVVWHEGHRTDHRVAVESTPRPISGASCASGRSPSTATGRGVQRTR